MYRWIFILSMIGGVAVGCKSTKTDTIKPLQWVLTLTDESDVSYINEKYATENFVCKDRISKTGYRYLCEYTGPRSESMALRMQLIEESQVQEVSNYIVKGSAEDVQEFKAKKAASIKK